MHKLPDMTGYTYYIEIYLEKDSLKSTQEIIVTIEALKVRDIIYGHFASFFWLIE